MTSTKVKCQNPTSRYFATGSIGDHKYGSSLLSWEIFEIEYFLFESVLLSVRYMSWRVDLLGNVSGCVCQKVREMGSFLEA